MSEPAPQPVPPTDAGSAQQVRVLVLALYLAGVITIAVGIAVGIAIDPVLFAIAALGIIDFVLARMFATGRIGPLAARRQAAESGGAAQIAEADASFNPYARED
jgi:hypothetical protein